ncbi:hypothetical protein CHS0354_007303 [Potamilus streckersoni]|uniref:Uncharacterized protein n=1 Tax=Potamilus streckersoni TaxID=2493646 RepID=A0AAE0TDA3_9BIVA|nr:hypothetical protein CHS0354_007303 [Potamilus streckersoni]
MARKLSVANFFRYILESPENKPRLVEKNGETNVRYINVDDPSSCCYPNVFINLVVMRKRWLFLLFSFGFISSWVVFAFGYYIISDANGDIPTETTAEDVNSTHALCIQNAQDFESILLFSMETQSTIGYGSRYVNENCSPTIMLVMIQSIFGCLLQSILTGVLLFKFQKPSKRKYTMIFSKFACIYEENKRYYIEIRILNMQRSSLLDIRLTGLCVFDKDQIHNKMPPHFRYHLEFNPCHGASRLFFQPTTFRHLIDHSSPFWDLCKRDIEIMKYEIILMLEGLDEIAGNFIQARTSYLSSEVKWGYRFRPMTVTQKNQMLCLNYNNFSETVPTLDMPDKSASMDNRKISTMSQGDSAYGGENDTFPSVLDVYQSHRRIGVSHQCFEEVETIYSGFQGRVSVDESVM